MRKSTSALRREMAAGEAADDHLSNKLTALLIFLETAERNRMERDDALRRDFRGSVGLPGRDQGDEAGNRLGHP